MPAREQLAPIKHQLCTLKNSRRIIEDKAQMGTMIMWSKFLKLSRRAPNLWEMGWAFAPVPRIRLGTGHS